jgi:cytochrome c peroxidase
MKKLIILSLLATVIILISCQEDLSPSQANGAVPNLPSNLLSYPKSLPTHISSSTGTWGGGRLDTLSLNPPGNRITDAGATLGRVLFYDKKLSYNNTVACGSCHLQSNAFADAKPLSRGFDGNLTTRNSPSIVNVAFQTSYFWDGRIAQLEDMVLLPLNNHIEMGIEKIENLETKLGATSYYPKLFADAFGTAEITKDNLSKALSQFIRSMQTFDAKIDQGRIALDPSEQRGEILFSRNCASCHSGTNFRSSSELSGSKNSSVNTSAFANIGLELSYKDKGLGEFISNREGYFRIPSLRNVELSGPYMHDGRFKTLEEVIEHYNSGIKSHPFLSGQLKDWNTGTDPIRMNLTEENKEDMLNFLKTLTDIPFINDDRYSDPFVR